uniref:Uncharacterized protein n=1 Tax=Sinocyclocheilus anshuiensis TaxID=1608454 RepID=A0A671SWJ2_9TELE
MGKSNSKLKPEVVEELTRKTYCKCFLTTLLRIKVPLKKKHFGEADWVSMDA